MAENAAMQPRATVPLRRQRNLLHRILANPLSAIGAALVCLAILVALLAPRIAPLDPIAMDLPNRLMPPSTAHWFGQRQTRELLDWRPRIDLDTGFARLAAAYAAA